MPILNKRELERRISKGSLILYPLRDSTGKPVVEPASYDLRVGIVLWKDEQSSQIIHKEFDETKPSIDQTVITLRPGQMVFVITHEELKLPEDVSGTVYSRNKLQKQNVLALNAGHVDPGYEGPIMIRLINLGAIPWPLTLGEAVFTVVFHTVQPSDGLSGHARRTKAETFEAAMKTAVEAFSNPFHDLYKDQIKRQLDEHYAGVENRLRKSFSDEFFRKDDVARFVFYGAAAVVAGITVVAKVPWLDLWHWVKALMGWH